MNKSKDTKTALIGLKKGLRPLTFHLDTHIILPTPLLSPILPLLLYPCLERYFRVIILSFTDAMPKLSQQEEYQRLLQQQQKLREQLKEIDNRAGQLNKNLQNKKKIILGSIILKRMKNDKKLRDNIIRILQSDLSEKDRVLFAEELQLPEQPDTQDTTSAKGITDTFNSSQNEQDSTEIKPPATKKNKPPEPSL